ncbi:MarR family winged helix-turn-helix transcriptional regulator [Devosia sp.]|uniref:MarR family winged helix-turn-helix transcriptional regulator n=1 Tax=Devosia sp. TaxID=1871048 RepID=UPI002F205115
MPANTQIATALSKIGMVLRSEQWQQAEANSLTPTQAQILVHLAARGPARLTEVAREIAVTQPTASDAVAALVRKRHVEKCRDPGDGRAVLLQATAPGRRAAQALAVWPDALLGAIDVLEPAEQAAFLKGLSKMIRALQQRGAIPVQRMCLSCRHFRPYAHADAAQPHHCTFVDAAFGDADLRLDCGDHAEAGASEAPVA